MKIAIIGFSRFGQLWAELMKQFGEVIVFNRSDQTEAAKKIGVEFHLLDQMDKISDCDFIFVATAISSIEEVIKLMAPHVKSEAVVMDVCSVKVIPCKFLKEHIKNAQLMGTHPMFGPDSVKSGLKDKQIVLCPLNIDSNNLQKIKSIFNKLELKIIETSPEEHDKQTAYSLAMVHFLGRGLEKIDLMKIQIKTLGFERLLQVRENVCHDSMQLFEDMQNFNPYARSMRQELLSILTDIHNKLR